MVSCIGTLLNLIISVYCLADNQCRDIKPENLLFYPIPFIPTKNPKPKSPEDEDKEDEGEFIPGVGAGGIGKIKIADFGLSKVVWDSQTMTPCGTVGYTAPEIVKDERYSKSVDMWALGCVLYTLLCGFPPFYDESIQVLTEKVARGQYTFLSPWWDDISKSAQDLVSHLLTVNPDKRYTIQEFLNHPWIRQSNEETHAAADAPPLATPLYTRQKEYGFAAGQGGGEAMSAQFLETPGGGLRRNDFRSPGAVNLREVFDVGYAVHRQEEEGKRRKNFPQGYRGAAGAAGLNALDEDDEDYEDDIAATTNKNGMLQAPILSLPYLELPRLTTWPVLQTSVASKPRCEPPILGTRAQPHKRGRRQLLSRKPEGTASIVLRWLRPQSSK